MISNRHIAHSPLLWLIGWTILNLLQAYASPIDADEAYYWAYAQQLDWGYFDHPPVVALLVYLGLDWLPPHLDIRFGTVLSSSFLMVILWDLVGQPRGERLWLFGLLCFAQPFLQAYSFITTPDAPLLLGTGLFFWAYQRYLSKQDWSTVLMWGASMAFLLYSKYHGILIIGLTVLSNRRLWRQPAFYLAGAFGACLFLPHLYWQWSHEFPSVRYHLAGRNDDYQLKYTLNYLLNQLLIFNPLLLFYFVRTFWRRRPQAPLESAFYWNVVGFFAFFLWSSFKGGTEAQWTAVLAIPLTVLLFREAVDRPANVPYLKTVLWGAAGLFLLGRLLLFVPVDSWPKNIQRRFNHRAWIAVVRPAIDDRVAVFQNSYRNASVYRYYTRRPAWTITDAGYRPSQYDLWQQDTALHNDRVTLLGHMSWECASCDTLSVGKKRFKVRTVDSLQIVKEVRFHWQQPTSRSLQLQNTLPLDVTVSNPYPFPIRPFAGDLPLQLKAIIRAGKNDWMPFAVQPLSPLDILPADTTIKLHLLLTPPDSLALGNNELRIGWAYQGMPPLAYQVEGLEVQIEP